MVDKQLIDLNQQVNDRCEELGIPHISVQIVDGGMLLNGHANSDVHDREAVMFLGIINEICTNPESFEAVARLLLQQPDEDEAEVAPPDTEIH